ncbi:glycoside hydrolase family 26 protein [Mycobacterium sp. 1274761.0]|uniref:glycoside hydrolase family 26 protein n=1 Tax=Mycobacterium sp. 1274761.0 TaxID=1834077 RepID=UPI001E5B34D0|nr:glycosyl hydrolase [Mycobacterium sp. 1274761.0]
MAAAVAEEPQLVLWFDHFDAVPPAAGINAVHRRHADPIITWEPWTVSLAAIADGEYDDHLVQWANAFRAYDDTVYLRFAHEFNGDWYPWSPAHGETPSRFVAAWRHIVDIFREREATSVEWVWCPNAVSDEDAPLTAWYPGGEYVDVLAADGYNWGDTRPDAEWIAPADLFDPVLTALRGLDANKPIFVAEVACAESGGSKADWIAELVSYLADYPGVDGFVWFEHDKETDWRMVSSSQAVAAMAAALKKRAAAYEVAP